MSKSEKKEALALKLSAAVLVLDLPSIDRDLKKFLKLGPFTAVEKHQISQWYSSLGDNDRAIAVLSPELSPHDLAQADFNVLANQFRLLYLLHIMGARYASSRLEKQLEQIIQARNIDFPQRYYRYWHYKSTMYRHQARPDLAVQCSSTAVQYYKHMMQQHPDDYQKYFHAYLGCMLNWSDASRGLQHQSQLRSMFLNELQHIPEEKRIFRAILLRSLADGLMDENRFDEAKHFLDQSATLLNMSDPIIEVVVLKRALGQYHAAIGDTDKARDFFLTSYQTVLEQHHNPNMGLASLAGLEQVDGDLVGFIKKLTLRCYPTYSPFSLRAGRLFNPVHHAYSEKWAVNKTDDSWLVSYDKIEHGDYLQYMRDFSFVFRLQNANKPWFDLRSGLYGLKLETQGVLPLLQLRALFYLVSSGEIGAPEVALIDYIYQEGIFVASTAEERLKFILKTLKKAGHKIVRRKNFYYYQSYAHFNFIIPMERHHISEHWAFRAQRPDNRPFKRRDLETFYCIHKATAVRWLNQWRERQLIADGPEQSYYFL